MAKTIDQQLQHYFMQLNEAEKKSVLQMLKTFLKGRKEKAERVSLEQYNKEIEEAMIEVENGEVYTHEEVVQMSKNW